jgi:hypothetical protein
VQVGSGIDVAADVGTIGRCEFWYGKRLVRKGGASKDGRHRGIALCVLCVLCMCVYVCAYKERKRERERARQIFSFALSVSLSVSLFVLPTGWNTIGVSVRAVASLYMRLFCVYMRWRDGSRAVVYPPFFWRQNRIDTPSSLPTGIVKSYGQR